MGKSKELIYDPNKDWRASIILTKKPRNTVHVYWRIGFSIDDGDWFGVEEGEVDKPSEDELEQVFKHIREFFCERVCQFPQCGKEATVVSLDCHEITAWNCESHKGTEFRQWTPWLVP